MIIASIVAIELEDLISSVIALSAVGLGLCLGFLILKAPNLAITQLVVEILCVVVLIRATIRRDLPLVRDGRWLFNTIATFFAIGCFLTYAYFILRELPVFGQPLMRVSSEYLTTALEKTGSANIVTAITLNFRRYDALAEAAVLFASVIAVLAITRKVSLVKLMKNNTAGMTLIVKTITRLTVGLILIYGIYIVLRGHISPGGGFAGGVIIALSFIHLLLAFGKDAVLSKINEVRGIFLASIGAGLFLIIATFGFLRQQYPTALSENFKLFGAGLIPSSDLAIALMVGCGLFVVFLALVLLTSEKEEK